MLSTPSIYNKLGPIHIMRLWLHEVVRTFEDRLIFEEDWTTFRAYVKEAFTKNFPEENPEFLEDKENIFTSFVAPHLGLENQYSKIKDMN